MAVEPSGPHSGTERDPLNESAASVVLKALQNLQPNVDLDLFGQFQANVLLSNQEALSHWDFLKGFRIKSQEVIGLDLQEGGSFKVKPYIEPLIRSLTNGTTPNKIMLDAVKKCWNGTAVTEGLSKIEEFLSSTAHPLLPEKSFLSFDCECPKTSRVKIYVGAQMKTLEEAYDFWTLGNRLQGEAINQGWDLVRKVWDSVFDKMLPGNKARESLTFSWNWELSPSNPNPAPKAYFLLFDDYDKHVNEAFTDLCTDLGWEKQLARHFEIQQAT